MKFMRVLLIFGLFAAIGCDKGSPSYSILAEGQSFSQATSSFNTKVDIVWVIDNSGSMATSQANLADSFGSFIDKFTDKGYDFKIGVASSDAFLAMNLPGYANFYTNYPRYFDGLSQSHIARFKDGAPGGLHSGIFVITPQTPDIFGTFMLNARISISGYGDERPLQSMRAALDSEHNAGFLRDDSFLAVIMVTDEDDFSHDGLTYLENQYTNPALHTIDSYVQYLDTLTGTTGANRRYQVNSISIKDSACLSQLNQGFTGRKIAQRVNALAEATGGIQASLCDDFGQSLDIISNQIVNLAARFCLSKPPVPDTIKVVVNGNQVPEVAGSQVEGWAYEADSNCIRFTDAYKPPQGASISVSFDPLYIEF